MIGDLKPYPATKDSGVEWLGKVPEHWEVRQLGRIGRFSKGNGGTKEDEVAEGVPCVRYGDLYTQHRFFVRNSRTCVTEEKAADYTPILHGDVLFAGSGETIEEIGKSAVNLISGPACCGGDVILFRPSMEVDANFLGYATDCPQAAYQKSCMGRGITVMHIYGDELKYMYVGLPPLPEQAAIVRYLDHVDRRVRRFVRAKQKLIGLLEEQKQAIIHRAVTRGLDPDVLLKDSGVEWLGELPADWEVRRAKYFYREVDERSVSGSEELMSVSHKTGVTPRKKSVTMFLAENNVGHKICRPGDLAINTMWAYMAALGVARQTGIVSPSYGVYRPIDPETLNPDFIDCLLRTERYKSEYLCRSTGITSSRLRLYPDAFLRIPILCPPGPEQAAIVQYIHDVTSDVQAGIKHTEREIELLHEYRTRLIADVVTGKLDVREAAAGLPDEPEDLEPFDETDALADESDTIPEEADA